MSLYYGAKHDLKNLIKTHLFIICATNSGTTFLRDALATSQNTWNLLKEGQHTYGFAGPNARDQKAYKLWAVQQRWVDEFTMPERYDWEKIKNAWYFQAYSKDPKSTVFVEKSPTFIMIVEQLIKEFDNPRFLFMVRNPYAVTEGIRRTTSTRWMRTLGPDEDHLNIAATQTINCLKLQKHNIETWGDLGIFFTYEEMCEKPEKIQESIQKLTPEIDDLILRQRIKIKTRYDEELRNMNDQQIERLSAEDIERINEIFLPHKETLDYFNYSLITPPK